MSRRSHLCWLVFSAVWILAGASLCENAIRAQPAGQSINIPTVDGVKLKGTFYQNKKSTAPTVIMLHPIGEGKSSKSPEWKNLAEALDAAGYSVMMFDFRGHGESMTIDDTQTFWSLPINKTIKTKDKESIDVKDFINLPAYGQVLVNDIAAVKAYLDRQHDKGACNTSNTIVIGADNGATLGAIWINSEWSRFKYTLPTMMGKPVVVDKRAEGSDIIAAVFLTIQPTLLPKKSVNVGSILSNPCKSHGMATAFFYGEKDTKAKDFAKTLESKLRLSKSKKHEFIGEAKVPDTSLSGVKLLTKGNKTIEAITGYLESVVAERTNEFIERDSQNALYIWRAPNGTPVSAKKTKGEKNLSFSIYDLFIPN